MSYIFCLFLKNNIEILKKSRKHQLMCHVSTERTRCITNIPFIIPSSMWSLEGPNPKVSLKNREKTKEESFCYTYVQNTYYKTISGDDSKLHRGRDVDGPLAVVRTPPEGPEGKKMDGRITREKMVSFFTSLRSDGGNWSWWEPA